MGSQLPVSSDLLMQLDSQMPYLKQSSGGNGESSASQSTRSSYYSSTLSQMFGNYAATQSILETKSNTMSPALDSYLDIHNQCVAIGFKSMLSDNSFSQRPVPLNASQANRNNISYMSQVDHYEEQSFHQAFESGNDDIQFASHDPNLQDLLDGERDQPSASSYPSVIQDSMIEKRNSLYFVSQRDYAPS